MGATEFCTTQRHEVSTLYRVDFNLSCGYVIINPRGCESVLGYKDRDDAEIEAGVLNGVYVRAMASQLSTVTAERDAIRELMNCYNLGGWTDAVAPTQRTLAAEAENEKLLAEVKAWRGGKIVPNDVKSMMEYANGITAARAATDSLPTLHAKLKGA